MAPSTTHPAPTRGRRVPGAAAAVATAGGVWSLVSAVLPHHPVSFVVDLLFNVVGVPATPNAFMGVLLLLMGGALRRRLRAAWVVAVCSVALTALTYLTMLALVEQFSSGTRELVALTSSLVVAGTAIVLVVLVRARRQFGGRRRQASVGRAVAVLAGGLALVFVVAAGVCWPLRGSGSTFGDCLWWAATHTVGLPGLHVASAHVGPRWLGTVTGVLSAGVLLLAVREMFASSMRAEFLTEDDELALRGLLRRDADGDSLGYFATRRDKGVVFDAHRRAAIGYRTLGTVCLAAGDPIGPRDAWDAVIAQWMALAHRHGLQPAVLAASEAGARAFGRAGLHARPLGDEAILTVASFDLARPQLRSVKRAAAHARRAGCEVTVLRHRDLTREEMSELTVKSELWRGDEPERGFSMALNRLGDPSDGRMVAVLTRDAQGDLVAVQSYVPWGRDGLSLDLMRRAPQAPGGVNEAMVCALVASCGRLGVRRISLNFAMFRSVFAGADRVGAGLGVRLAGRFLTAASRYWQLESLYESNAKYEPEWAPRFVCFANVSDLPRIGIAAGVAEGFLPGRAPAVPRDHDDPTAAERREAFAARVREQELASADAGPGPRRLSPMEAARHRKLAVLRSAGRDPYPPSVPRNAALSDVGAALEGTDPTRPPAPAQLHVTGRVRALRDLGGVRFAVLEESGSRVQVVLERDVLTDEDYDLWARTVDIGDHVAVSGTAGYSRSGHPSLLATGWAMASKSLRPVPALHQALTNAEARMRNRHLDLIANPGSREVLQARSAAVRAIRDAFTARGFHEVETPMLQHVHGGATARPFTTHINAYNEDLYLRIAPELALKRLAVGGMDRIFELNRNFRNEGADATHNPEFTSIEAYAAYEDYHGMRELTRAVILDAARAVHGAPVAVRVDDHGAPQHVDLSAPWPVITVHDALSQAVGTTLTPDTDLATLRRVAEEAGIRTTHDTTPAEIVTDLYDELVEARTTFPTFYTDFPIEASPLTRTHRGDPRLAERWDLVAFGAEIGTAYTELVDPVDQRRRLTEQSLQAAAGDPEAMELDEGFLAALECGMPPTGGLGLGVDRIVMLLTGTSIRATLAFPYTRAVRHE